MRSILAFVVMALAFVACRPASSPEPSSAEDVAAKTVALVHADMTRGPRAFCSGVWVGDHDILTAKHCIEGEEEADVSYASYGDVTIPDAKTTTAILRGVKFVKTDDDHDLALLYAEAAPPHATAHVSRHDPVMGEFVQAMGHPLGLWWSYSTGTVSGVRYFDAGDLAMKWIFATAPVSPGNSGGGLFDAHGDLLGICHGGFRPPAQVVNVWVHREHIIAFLAAR